MIAFRNKKLAYTFLPTFENQMAVYVKKDC